MVLALASAIVLVMLDSNVLACAALAAATRAVLVARTLSVRVDMGVCSLVVSLVCERKLDESNKRRKGDFEKWAT